MNRRFLFGCCIGVMSCTRGDDDTDDSCGLDQPTRGEPIATTYTVRSGDTPVFGAAIYVNSWHGTLRGYAVTASDGTATIDVDDASVVTVQPYPMALQQDLQSVVGVRPGEPLTFYVGPPQGGVSSPVSITAPPLNVNDWVVRAHAPCLVDYSYDLSSVAWNDGCVATAAIAGATHAPLVAEAVMLYGSDLQFLVDDDVELGSTDAIDLPGPWGPGTEETLSLSTAPDPSVLAVELRWRPLVGPFDGSRMGWEGYANRARITGAAGNPTTTFRRVPLQSDAALLSYSEEDNLTLYTVYTRLDASAFGSLIAVDNQRTLTGPASLTYDDTCGHLSTSSADGDYMALQMGNRDGTWSFMLPPDVTIAFPEIEEFEAVPVYAQFSEVDLLGAEYLDLGDLSTLPSPPMSHHERHGFLTLPD